MNLGDKIRSWVNIKIDLKVQSTGIFKLDFGKICLYMIISFFAISLSNQTNAQELRNYSISCSETAYQNMVNNPEQNIIIDCSIEYEGNIWDDAVLSLREGPYRFYPKKSFKIDFADDNSFENRNKMNLMAEWNDSSFAREYMTYDLFRNAGLSAPETWYVRLYLNDVYMGLYLDVEEIDENYLSNSGLSENSAIYRADTVGCLLTLFEELGTLWEKITFSETGYYDLNNLIQWLDTTPDSMYFTGLSSLFSVNALARTIAINSIIGNQSTYYDNYILIHDLDQNGLWNLLPRDADSTFTFWEEYIEPQYYNCGHQMLPDINVLLKSCWLDSEMQSLIFEHMTGIMDSVLTEEYYQELTNNLEMLLYDAVSEDTLKQFSNDAFVNALSAVPANISGRKTSLEDRLETEPLPFDIHPAILTPEGVYFSWDSTSIQSGGVVTYVLEISEDPTFTPLTASIGVNTNISLLYDDIDPGDYYWRVKAFAPSGDWVRCLSFYSEFSVPENAFSGTVITGNISGNEIWDLNGSPYSLPQGLVIEESGTLEIEPGVLVGIGPGKSLIVNGSLIAIGTELDSIHFVSLDPDTTWGSIMLPEASSEVILSFVKMTGSSEDRENSILTPPSTFQVANLAELHISDSHIIGNDLSIGIRTMQCYLYLERVKMEHFWNMIGILGGLTIVDSCRFSFCGFEQLDIEVSGQYNQVLNNQFYGGNGDGVDLDQVTHCIIAGNYIDGVPDKGISIGTYCDNIEIYNNIIVNCGTGIAVKSSCNATLYNNVTAFCGTGLARDADYALTGLTDAYNNLICTNDVEVFVFPGVNLNLQYSLIEGDTLYPGQGNLNADPQLVDIWNNNFYPLHSSPLIDAGWGTDQPELDILDSARTDIPEIPNTGAGNIDYVDIGAYEFYNAPASVKEIKQIPETYQYLWNYPNPFNNTTKINFTVYRKNDVEIVIFNVLGQLVYSRFFKDLTPGSYSILWDGDSNHGYGTASGIYFCTLISDEISKSIKMVLLK